MHFSWLLLRRLTLKLFIGMCAATCKLFLKFSIVSTCVSNVSDGCSKLVTIILSTCFLLFLLSQSSRLSSFLWVLLASYSFALIVITTYSDLTISISFTLPLLLYSMLFLLLPAGPVTLFLPRLGVHSDAALFFSLLLSCCNSQI